MRGEAVVRLWGLTSRLPSALAPMRPEYGTVPVTNKRSYLLEIANCPNRGAENSRDGRVEFGRLAGARTRDNSIKSRVLYQLSYEPLPKRSKIDRLETRGT